MKPLHCALLLLATGCASVTEEDDALRTASFDGVAIAYDDRGAGDPTLVFVHGWCCRREYWRRQVAEFSSAHRVVTLDLAGHGSSGRNRQHWDLPSLARDVQAVVEHLDLAPVILVGHSMGGPVSLLAAALMPERVVGVIAADALHDAEYSWDEEQMSAYIRALDSDFVGMVKQSVRASIPPDADPETVARLVADVELADPEVGIALARSFEGFDLREAFRACPAPIYCINAAFPLPTRFEENRRYARSFNGVVMEGVGHFLMLEKPAEFNERLWAAIGLLSGQP